MDVVHLFREETSPDQGRHIRRYYEKEDTPISLYLD